MRKRTPSWALAAVLMALPAAAQIPPGFELVQITNTPYREDRPRINSRGQIVYWARFTSDPNTGEIMLYDNGEHIQITNDNIPEGFADINDDGTIVWTKAIGPPGPYGPTREIMMYSNGVVTRLTNDADDDVGVRINNLGHVVWYKRMGSGCGGGVYDIYFYDGQNIRPITTDAVPNDVVNASATVNDADEIAWTRYNFCVSPWESKVMLHSAGQTVQVSQAGELEPQGAFINNLGEVGWNSLQANGRDAIYIWENGRVSLFSDWGGGPMLSDVGDVGFSRWDASSGTAHSWLYRSGTWFQLTNDPFQLRS